MENNTYEIYHSDHLGSSSYITDNFGRPSHYYEYLPFGELLTEHNQSKYYLEPYPTQNMDSYNNPYKFNGKEMDKETGMYYYGARYYDPRISIFVSVDPLAEETMEPYLYTGNNPIMFTDPTGMSKEGGEDWVYNKKDKTYHWDSKVNKPSDITNSNYEYVGKSTDDVKDHYDNNNWFGNPEFGNDLNAPWSGEIKEYKPTTMKKWSESDSFLGQASYEFANSFYLSAQSLNPFQDRETIQNIGGTGATQSERVEAGVWATVAFIPTSKGIEYTAKGGKFLMNSKVMYQSLSKGKNGFWNFRIGLRNTKTNYHFRLERHQFNSTTGTKIHT